MARKLLIGALALLLLGGAAAGAALFLGARDADAKAEAAPVLPGDIVTMPPLAISSLRGAPRILMLQIQLELAPGRRAEELAGLMPRIEDAFVGELSALAGYGWPDGRIVDLEFARQRLLARAAQVTGPEMVARILIPGIQATGPAPY